MRRIALYKTDQQQQQQQEQQQEQHTHSHTLTLTHIHTHTHTYTHIHTHTHAHTRTHIHTHTHTHTHTRTHARTHTNVLRALLRLFSLHVFNFTHPPVLSAQLLTLSASRFLAPDSPLLVPELFLSSVHLHGMTFPFLSDRNPLWTHSSVTQNISFSKTIDPSLFSVPFCCLVHPSE